MADFDDDRTRYRPRGDNFARQLLIVAAVLGAAVLAGYLLFFTGAEEPATPEATPVAALTPEPTPELTPEPTPPPTPEPTPAGPPVYARDGSLHALAFRITGPLSTSLAAALPAQYLGVADTLARRLDDALRWRLNTQRELRKGDTAKIVFNPEATTERAPLYGFQYHSQYLKQDLFYIYFPQGTQAGAPYFDARGNSVVDDLERPPLAEADLASARVRNLGKNGLNYRVPAGTRVIAPFPGRVLRMNWDTTAWGRSVEVRYMDSGAVAWFTDLDHVAEALKPGAMIATGGTIGDATDRGFTYRMFRPNPEGTPEPISPFDLHGKKPRELPAADRVSFLAIRTKVEKLFDLVQVPTD